MRSIELIRSNRPLYRTIATVAVAAVCLTPGTARGFAQDEPAPLAREPLERDTPRSAMQGYLEACRAGDYERAAEYLTLGDIAPALRPSRGPRLARHLKTVLDRELWVELERLSDIPDGDPDDGLPRGRDLVGTIETGTGPVPIMLERLRSREEKPIWTIAAATVSRIPALYEEFGYGPLGERLPAVFFEIRFLEVQLWQWIGLAILIVVTAAVAWLAAVLAARILRGVLARSRVEEAAQLARVAKGPLALAIGLLVFAAGAYPVGLAVPARAFLAGAERALAIVAIVWLLIALVGAGARVVEANLVARGQAIARSIVPLARRTLNLLIAGVALLAILQNLGINVTSLLAGLGIGGLAVALAAQKTVENLFGGVTLIADQPVRVGDFCRFGDKLGTVEEVGLRSTRVRTLDRTVVTVPNAEFASMQLENFTRRDRIWLHATIGLRYETTPDQLRYLLVALKKLLVAHPRVHPDPARVRFVGFGAYSLDLEIFAYIATSDINEFLAVQEDLLLRVMDVVAASGSGFAFPSQTIYTAADSGLNTERTRKAEAAVQQWRAANELGLPNFRPDQMASLAGTLDYPPKGSAVRATEPAK